MHELPQQPGFPICAATDHDPICTALFKRRFAVFDGADIAIDYHGEGNRLFHLAYKGPVGAVPVHLTTCSAMYDDHLCAEIFCNMRQFRGIQALVIPAHPHFYRDGDIDRSNRCLDQRGSKRKITHQGRPGITIDNLFYRTAHVDVDYLRTAILVKLGGLGHGHRVTARKLHRNRLFSRVPSAFLQGLTGFADHGLTGDHFGDIQAGAEAPDEFPKRQVGHTRHRCENYRAFNFYIADRDGEKFHFCCLKFKHSLSANLFVGKNCFRRNVSVDRA